MPAALSGKTVAILEHRYTREFAGLLERWGAKVESCPLTEEQPVEDREAVRGFVSSVIAGSFDTIIFLTGVGARFLIEEAARSGQDQAFVAAVRRTCVVGRGPKPAAALHRAGIQVDVTPTDPTSEGIVARLTSENMRGRRVGLQLYGVPHPEMVASLEALGAEVVPIQVYRYGLASRPEQVRLFLDRTLSGEFAAVAFTSAVQVEALFAVAQEGDRAKALREGLGRVAVAAIGDVTRRALEAQGVEVRIIPSQSRMAALAESIAAWFQQNA